MKKIFLLTIPVFILVSCKEPVKQETHHEMTAVEVAKDSCCVIKDGVFYHISSGYENPHRVLMAMKMALMMAEDKDVILYLDIEAVKLVLKDSKDMTFKDFPPLKELLENLIAKKITIMACPACLKVAGKTSNDLMEGVIVAQKEKFFDFTKGRIITLDY